MGASRLALLGIVMMIDIVAEHGEGLTIPNVDHSPHKRRLTGRRGITGRCLRTTFLRCNEGSLNYLSVKISFFATRNQLQDSAAEKTDWANETRFYK